MKKKSFWGKMPKQMSLFNTSKSDKVLKALQHAASAAIAGVSVGIGITYVEKMFDYFEKRKIKAKSKEYYVKMLDGHPELKKEDPAQVAKYWESLYHFAPYMAQDPLAAGAYIRQSLARGYAEEFGGPPPDTFATLSNINKQMVDSAKSGKDSPTRKSLRNVITSVIPEVAAG